MNFLEHEYRKRFGNQKLPADRLPSEELWTAIEAQLPAAASKPKAWYFQRGLWALLLLCLLTALAVWLMPRQSSELPNLSAAAAAEPSMEQAHELRSPMPAETVSEPSTQTTTEQQAFPNTGKQTLLPPTPNRGEQPEAHRLAASVGPLSNDSPLSNSGQAEEALESNAPPLAQSVQKMRPLPTLSASVHHSQAVALPALQSFSAEQRLRSPSANASGWQIGAFAGSNLTALRFRSNNQDLAKLMNDSEQLYPGFSAGLQASFQWKNKWMLSTGLEYHRLWSKLDYSQERAVEVFKENQLLEVRFNQRTGAVLSERYGDTTIHAIETRTVQHYNQYQIGSIPLEAGLTRQLGKLRFGASVGPVLHLRIQQAGRSIQADGSITSFETANGPFPSAQIGLSGSTFLGYELTQHWGIALRTQWRYGQATQVHIHQFHVNAGLNYRW